MFLSFCRLSRREEGSLLSILCFCRFAIVNAVDRCPKYLSEIFKTWKISFERCLRNWQNLPNLKTSSAKDIVDIVVGYDSWSCDSIFSWILSLGGLCAIKIRFVQNCVPCLPAWGERPQRKTLARRQVCGPLRAFPGRSWFYWVLCFSSILWDDSEVSRHTFEADCYCQFCSHFTVEWHYVHNWVIVA